MPTRFIHSRSSLMPASVMFPFIQCHHTRGAADCGGVAKPLASASAFSASAPRAMVPVLSGSNSEAKNRQRLLELGFKCNAHLPERIHRLPTRNSADGTKWYPRNDSGRDKRGAAE